MKKKLAPILLSLFLLGALFAQSGQMNRDQQKQEDNLLAQLIQSKGNRIISFDTSNIKQFWIDNSVVSKKDSFEIALNQKTTKLCESVPLKIQLINVNECQDCKIEVIANTEHFDLSVLNNRDRVISNSSSSEKFISYTVVSSVFHLEDTRNSSFSLVFRSETEQVLSIKKIILSFLENPNSSFLASPGRVRYTEKTINTDSKLIRIDKNTFSATGKRSQLFSSKKIIVASSPLSASVKIKNIGDNPLTIYIGYNAYTKELIELRGSAFPYKASNKVLSVISAEKDSERIIVDSYTDWTKGCFLTLNPKEDLSDIPNNTFVSGKINRINKIENGQAEIILDKPLNSGLKEGTKLRVHGLSGAYIYTSKKELQPGEEHIFTSTIKKDEEFLEYSSKAFSRGVYCVVPLILSYSIDSSKENTIQISDYTISY